MPEQATESASAAPDLTVSTRPGIANRRRRTRKCRTCNRPCLAALRRGECPDCAGLQPLPLRGEGGRFIQLHSEPTGADVNPAARFTRIVTKGGAA